jgi:UDP-MurNAc hydroxylase
MKVQWFRSATVGIETKNGTKILCDPWLTDGAFIGSWFHWPPLNDEYEEILKMDWDYLYISHLHPDHFDRKFVADLARKNRKVKVLSPKFENPWLHRAIVNCGFDETRINVLESNKRYTFADLSVRILTADYCNPLDCGVSIPCSTAGNQKSTIDSLAIFEADGNKILNANDALAVKSIENLWPVIGEVDLLMGHFGGAGPFPQCFLDIEDDLKITRATETARMFVKRLGLAANKTRAKFVFPYAGQYVLGGKLTSLNNRRSVMPLGEVQKLLESTTSAEVITLSPFAEFNLETGEASSSWEEPSPSLFDEYIKKIKTVRFPYELKELTPSNFDDSLKSAAERVLNIYRMSEGLADTKISTITLKSESHALNLHFNGKESTHSTQIDFESELQTVIRIPDQLLFRIVLKRENYTGFTQYHFNQAEIGSHLNWQRSGSYDNATKFLNFFHT